MGWRGRNGDPKQVLKVACGSVTPRSEVFGVTARGEDDQVFARDVDVESSPIVVGGPEASPVYVVTLIGEARLPLRFASALKTLTVADLSEVRTIIASA